MGLECMIVLAHAFGRTLVVPPQQHLYLLGKQHKGTVVLCCVVWCVVVCCSVVWCDMVVSCGVVWWCAGVVWRIVVQCSVWWSEVMEMYYYIFIFFVFLILAYCSFFLFSTSLLFAPASFLVPFLSYSSSLCVCVCDR